MKINYINQYSLSEAVQKYTETKIWKIGGKAPEDRPTSLVDYLANKVGAFVAAYPEEKRAEVRACFESKLKEIAEKNFIFPIKNFNKKELLNRIRGRFANCFPGMTHQILPYEGKYQDKWIIENAWLLVQYKIEKSKGGSPKIIIELLNSVDNSSKHSGRAAKVLKVFVEALQTDRDPNAEISLNAWTGSNQFMRAARGIYIWSRLGFEPQETKKHRQEFELSPEPVMSKLKRKFLRKLDDSCFLEINRFFTSSAEQLGKKFDNEAFARSFPSTCKTATEAVSKANYPWEIAELVVGEYPYGKFLTTQQEGVYCGVLYPNLPNSPGMQKYMQATAVKSP